MILTSTTKEKTENFSYNRIVSDLTIPEHQQMFVYQELKIDLDFEIELRGEIILK
jgi:hypothetical protein